MPHTEPHLDEYGGCQCHCAECMTGNWALDARKPCICKDCKCNKE